MANDVHSIRLSTDRHHEPQDRSTGAVRTCFRTLLVPGLLGPSGPPWHAIWRVDEGSS
jgi:hypothetical protein